MQVTIQATPNPNAMKFVLPARHFAAPLSFDSEAAAASHPLAAQLFALGDVYNVFMVQDFITVNKYPDADWDPLQAEIQTTIEHFFGET